MRVGVLELLSGPVRHPAQVLHRSVLTKQYASVTPQAVSAWCRQMGHETFYGIYYGVGLIGLLLLGIYGLIAPGAGPSTIVGVVLAFFVGQLFLLARVAVRLTLLGSQMEFYRRMSG